MIFRGPNFSVTPQRLWENTAVVRVFLFGISKGSGRGGKKAAPEDWFQWFKRWFLVILRLWMGRWWMCCCTNHLGELCVLFFWSINDPGKSGFFWQGNKVGGNVDNLHPRKLTRASLRKGRFQKESVFNHYFSGDMLVFEGVTDFW